MLADVSLARGSAFGVLACTPCTSRPNVETERLALKDDMWLRSSSAIEALCDADSIAVDRRRARVLKVVSSEVRRMAASKTLLRPAFTIDDRAMDLLQN